MTPRKELFIKVKQALSDNVPELEKVDLQRKQFSNPESEYGTVWTAALIAISSIRWESMVEQKQEGTCTVDVTLYCKDGWLDQHNGTADDEHGLIEIDLIDKMVESLQFLQGDYFKVLELSEEVAGEENGIMTYTLSFTTNIYRRINPKYGKASLSINQPTP
ncbi:hypothetical protein JJC03_15545 [Flavobacterium oreochromis]|uniref:hypothetical protein n=1 Tax=Flavobacterium oreochromis TaxID=2906078 RepID=UPI001CE4DB73|nr:hypothetical protein [Flavobacterium oreochromis]QYS86315.1 hypothetical protein JJC03_15545 [Flavobacterium oreochromis]